MKKLLVICAVALVVASCGNKAQKNEAEVSDENVPMVDVSSGMLPIAIVNTDTLLNNYFLAIEANESLMTKQENARLDLS